MSDLNTPGDPARERFDARNGKRHVVFEASGHAPFQTEPDRFIEIVRGKLDDLDIPR